MQSILHASGGGHGIGFGPRTFDIAPFEEGKVEAGMILCLEPGIYVPEVDGIRVEDMVAVRKAGRKY
jgi:Xaa-Pro aminopeptidase